MRNSSSPNHKRFAGFNKKSLLIYPNKPGMILGLAGTLALKGAAQEAVELIERGLPLSENEKQKATMRAALCFLYLKCGNPEKLSSLHPNFHMYEKAVK